MKKMFKLAAVLCASLGLTTAAQAQDEEFQNGIPNIAAIGVGGFSDYVGSNDYKVGAAPLLRYNFGNNRFINVIGNFVSVNLWNHPNWRFGPALTYRFGRGHVKDDVVNATKNFGDTVEVGAFVGYDYPISGSDGRDRWTITGRFTQDVGSVHKGYVLAGSVQRLIGVGRYGILGFNVGTTFGSGQYNDKFFSVNQRDAFASGLDQYDADADFRDVRAIAVYVQPISRHWMVGAGGMYQRMVGDPGKSPIVKDRGSKDQFIFGAGLARAW